MPAGTISQTARGFVRLLVNSASEAAPTACSFTSSATAFADISYTAHWCPPFKSRRTIFAPIRPRPIIPSCTRQPSLKGAKFRSAGGRGDGRTPGLLEDVDELTIAPGDLGHGFLARRLLGPPG